MAKRRSFEAWLKDTSVELGVVVCLGLSAFVFFAGVVGAATDRSYREFPNDVAAGASANALDQIARQSPTAATQKMIFGILLVIASYAIRCHALLVRIAEQQRADVQSSDFRPESPKR